MEPSPSSAGNLEPADFNQALEAGVWEMLGPAEHASLRLVSRSARAFSCRLLATAVLLVPSGDAAGAVKPAKVAAFHRSLSCMDTLVLQLMPGDHRLESAMYCVQYFKRLAAGGAGLPARRLLIRHGEHRPPYSAVAASVLRCMPQLRVLSLACSGSLGLLRAKEALSEFRGWQQPLTLELNLDPDINVRHWLGVGNGDAKAALRPWPAPTRLDTLLCSCRALSADDLQGILAVLPQLACIGGSSNDPRGLDKLRQAESHNLGGVRDGEQQRAEGAAEGAAPPAQAADCHDPTHHQHHHHHVGGPQAGTWHPLRSRCSITHTAIAAASPGLQRLQDCTIDNGGAGFAYDAAALQAVQAASERFEGCAASWALASSLCLWNDCCVAPSSLPRVLNMVVRIDHSLFFDVTPLAPHLAAVMAAAPRLRALHLALGERPMQQVVQAAGHALQHAAGVRTVWLDTPCACAAGGDSAMGPRGSGRLESGSHGGVYPTSDEELDKCIQRFLQAYTCRPTQGLGSSSSSGSQAAATGGDSLHAAAGDGSGAGAGAMGGDAGAAGGGGPAVVVGHAAGDSGAGAGGRLAGQDAGGADGCAVRHVHSRVRVLWRGAPQSFVDACNTRLRLGGHAVCMGAW